MTFRFLNIPVYIRPTFWIFLIFFTNIYRNPSVESLILGLVLLFSLLVHEYGHALTSQFFGARPTIILEAFGGSAQYNAQGITPKQRFFITLNGPLFESLLIFIPFYLLKSGVFAGHYYAQYTLYVMMRLNILWCLLNLIPIVPLDGGQLVRHLLEGKWGASGIKASHVISLICVASVCPILFLKGYYFFGFILVIFGVQNLQALLRAKGKNNENAPYQRYLQGAELIKEKQFGKAIAVLSKLIRSKDAHIKHLSVEALAKAYFLHGEKQKAYDLLIKATPETLKEGKGLLCRLAFEKGNYALVAKYSRAIYEIEPTREIALLNAQAFSHLGKTKLAEGWENTASQFACD